MAGKVTRGIRNNNPGNVRLTATRWKGQIRPGSDKEFCVFSSMEYGIRALIVTLRTYVVKRKVNTVRKMISRWAPANENHTEAYIKYIENYIQSWGHDPYLPFTKADFYVKANEVDNWPNGKFRLYLMVERMCKMESSFYMGTELFEKAYQLSIK